MKSRTRTCCRIESALYGRRAFLGERRVIAGEERFASDRVFLDVQAWAAAYKIGELSSCKQTRPRRTVMNSLTPLKKIGAGEGIRTLDPNLGKVVLYP